MRYVFRMILAAAVLSLFAGSAFSSPGEITVIGNLTFTEIMDGNGSIVFLGSNGVIYTPCQLAELADEYDDSNID